MVMSVWLAAVLVAVATLAGSWLARRSSMRVSVGLAIASALMLVTALGEIVPDAVDDAIEQNVPLWGIGLSIVFGFVVITYFTREGAPTTTRRHRPGTPAGVHRRVKAVATAALFGGTGTAVALAIHRAIEGATLTLTGASAVVLLALLVHSVSEGLALTAMLDLAGKKVGFWMFLACLEPGGGHPRRRDQPGAAAGHADPAGHGRRSAAAHRHRRVPPGGRRERADAPAGGAGRRGRRGGADRHPCRRPVVAGPRR